MLPNIDIAADVQAEILKSFSDTYHNETIAFGKRMDLIRMQQMQTVEKYGPEGLMLVLEYELRLHTDEELLNPLAIFHYTNTPLDCEWNTLAQLSLKDALKKIWEHFPCKFSQTLADYCTDLFLVNASGKCFLAYAYLNANYDGDDFYEFFLGAVPQPNAQLPNELIQAGWQMPEDLKNFYKVHSVFGDPHSAVKNSKVYCISSANNLKASLGFMEEVVKEQDDLQPYSFYDLLPFWEDGGGNSQNFYKASPGNNSYMTTHWDHETRELGREMSFADYLDEQFGRRARAEW